MYSAVLQSFRKIIGEVKLRHRLAAGNGYTSAVFKEPAVLHEPVIYPSTVVSHPDEYNALAMHAPAQFKQLLHLNGQFLPSV